MRVITIVTDANNYLDRLRSIDALATHVKQCIVLSRSVPENARSVYPATEFLRPSTPLKGMRFFLWAANTAKHISRHNEREFYVIEIATAMSLLLLRWFWRSSATLIPQLVFPTATFLADKGWAKDPFAPAPSRRQILKTHFHYRRELAVLRLAERTCDAFIANSAQSLGEIDCTKRPAAVIPNCVYVPHSDHFARPNDEPRFLASTKLAPLKGIGVLFEAFRQYRMKTGKGILDLAGAPLNYEVEWFDALKGQFVDIAPYVHLCGHVERSRLTQLYRQSHALIHTSFYEGSPRAIYEALANGCPVVASDIPGVREISEDRSWFRVFPAGNPAACCEAMLAIGGQDRTHEMQEFIHREYSPEQRASRLFRFLTSLSQDALGYSPSDSLSLEKALAVPEERLGRD